MKEAVNIETLQAILEEAKVDYEKLYVKGNKAAATRLRKKYQEVIVMCKEGRKEASEKVNALKAK